MNRGGIRGCEEPDLNISEGEESLFQNVVDPVEFVICLLGAM